MLSEHATGGACSPASAAESSRGVSQSAGVLTHMNRLQGAFPSNFANLILRCQIPGHNPPIGRHCCCNMW